MSDTLSDALSEILESKDNDCLPPSPNSEVSEEYESYLTYADYRILQRGNNSDLTIRCQEVDFRVHRLYIRSYYSTLRLAIDEELDENIDDSPPFTYTTEKGRTPILDLGHEDLDSVKRMIVFLYTGTYSDVHPIFGSIKKNHVFEFGDIDPENVPPEPSETRYFRKCRPFLKRLDINLSMIGLGDKYDLPFLQHHAEMRIPNRYDRDLLLQPEFIRLVQKALQVSMYPASNIDIRAPILMACVHHGAEIIESEAWQILLQKNPEICYELFSLSIVKWEHYKTSRLRAAERLMGTLTALEAKVEELRTWSPLGRFHFNGVIQQFWHALNAMKQTFGRRPHPSNARANCAWGDEGCYDCLRGPLTPAQSRIFARLALRNSSR